LKIIQNNIPFTDNTQECDNDTILISSKQNKKFIKEFDQSLIKKVIEDKDLINYFDFSNIKIVGITGTNGKTTTGASIYSFLLDLDEKVAFQGTRGLYINEEKIKEYSLTTPVQLEIFENIQIAINNKCQYFIMEVSSHALAQNRICGLKFALKIHTNITRDHLDYHKTLEEYINIKNSFFIDETPKLINRDDKNVRYKIKNAFSYGLDNPSTYKVQAFTFKNGTTVALQYFGELFHFNSELRGTFNVYNLTAALAATHILTKKPLQDICDIVDNFAGVSGRMEIVNHEPLVVVDFAHTPDSMKSVFDSYKDKNIIVVFGAGGNRDRDKRFYMGKSANEYAKHIFVTSDNPRFEDPELICNDIIKGIDLKHKITLELNRKEAIIKAIKKAKEFDDAVVLILGKGDETHQIIYDKKFIFNDKDIVQNICTN